jgi:hypothetical protein
MLFPAVLALLLAADAASNPLAAANEAFRAR